MTVTNPLFYFSIMAAFVIEGWILSAVLPFHVRVDAEERRSGRLTPLDGLRGVLALSVFFTHATSYWFVVRTGVWDVPPSNFYAQMARAPVTMFFFITGYLFWSKVRLKPEFPIARFWFGRLGRLAPVYFAACLGAFLFAAVLSGFHRNVPALTLFEQATTWLADAGLPDLNAVSGSHIWLIPAWSLRYEGLFYLTLPFLGWFAVRLSRTLLLLSFAIGLALSAHFWTRGHEVESGPVFYLSSYLHFFAYTFSVGILVAMLPRERFAQWLKGRKRALLAALFSLALLTVCMMRVAPNYGPIESAWLSIPFACICFGETWFGFLPLRAVRFLGRISYSFYLLHLLILSMAVALLKRFGPLEGVPALQYWAIITIVGMATILVCAFAYQWLEHPFLNVGKGPGGNPLPAIQAAEPVVSNLAS